MSDARKQLRWSKLKAGLVITIAILVFVIGIFFAGNIQSIFSKKEEFKIQFHDVQGLRKGAPIWILGIEEGSVKNIAMHPTYGGVIVTVAVNRNAMKFIKEDSQATILTMGLLGDKYVDLSIGSPEAKSIRPGEMIQGMTESGLAGVMETSGKAIDKITQVIERLDSLITKIEQGQGTIAKFINDPTLYNNLTKTSQTLSQMLDDVSRSRGTLKSLIEDPSLYNRMLAAAASIEEFSRTLKEPGTLKKLIEDPSLYDRALMAVSRLEEFSKQVTESKGTLHKLISDPALYDNLDKSSTELLAILGGIEKGEGLAGTLLKDRHLAEESKGTIEELKGTIEELKALLKDIREHPKKYFKFSVF